jgi:hypothetical protein
MKRLSYLFIGVFFFVGAVPATVLAVYDLPHIIYPPWDSAYCYSCHITGLHHNTNPTYPGSIKDLCESCHVSGGEATPAVTHSSRIIDNDYGDWEVDCWSCHSPHHQRQDDKYLTTYGKYIKTTFNAEEIKEINPNDPGPYWWPTPSSPLRTVSSSIIKFTGPSEFVDGDAEGDDDICQVCHLNTMYYRNDPPDGPQFNFHADYGSDSQPGGNCTTCHTHNDGFKPGGHSDDDFGWSGNCSECHGDGSETEPVVRVIHSDTCTLCHVDPAAGDYTRRAGTNGSALLAADRSATCATCHPSGTYSSPFIHHDLELGSQTNGNCHNCHTDPRIAEGLPTPSQLSCRECHIQDNAGTLEIHKISVSTMGSATATGDSNGIIDGGAAGSGNSAHSFPNTSAVNNYGACFYCHGDSGHTAGLDGTLTAAVVPYHALALSRTSGIGGNASWYVQGAEEDVGNYNCAGTNFKDPQEFRVGNNGDMLTLGSGKNACKNIPMGADAYWGAGRDSLRIGMGIWSLPKFYTQGKDYFNQMQNTWDIYAMPATSSAYTFESQTLPHATQYYVPVFDTDYVGRNSAGGYDDVAITDVTWNVGNRTLSVTATSSAGAGLTMTLVYTNKFYTMTDDGGGSYSWSIDFDTVTSTTDEYVAEIPGVVHVISSNGGNAAYESATPGAWY